MAALKKTKKKLYIFSNLQRFQLFTDKIDLEKYVHGGLKTFQFRKNGYETKKAENNK